jgi:hypothetical protein
LSGELNAFYQLFPYLVIEANEEELVLKAVRHQLGPTRMKVSLRRFGLDDVTFEANLATIIENNR